MSENEKIVYEKKENYLNIDDDEEEDLLVSQLNMDISNQYVVFSVSGNSFHLV